ncbi:uncharacterized protein [Oscarella lobularis]|uniref:uncharacterized protein n=1 Tax=Oscarella lobularis TaxID=121494 RepID=UPI003314137C
MTSRRRLIFPMALVSVADYEEQAKERLPSLYWRFFSEGAIGGKTVKWNRRAFERLRLRPRVLHRDVSKVDTHTTIQGEQIAFPVCVAPTASHCLAHPDGELATAQAAAELGTCLALSHVATKSVEDVARAGGREGLRWLQLYIFRDRSAIVRLVRRAEAVGYKALAVTVDHPVIGKRRTPLSTLPPHLHMPNVFDEGAARHEEMFWRLRGMIDAALTWDDIDWLRSVTTLPVVVKGIHTAEDAREAVKRGIAGVWISNHGGRQLDGVPATIDILPEVVRAVNGKAEVYLDGGVRYGTDVFKAIALGARAVFVGRPVLWGLAHSGKNGASQVLQILRNEFETTMALAGCSTIADIKPSLVAHENDYRPKL